MDFLSTFGVPMIGAVFQWLVNTGWDTVKNWNSDRKDELISAPEATVLRGDLGPLRMRHDASSVSLVSRELEFLRENYGGLERLTPDDEALIASLARLRHNLEVLFGQRITFQGEDNRAESGTRLGTDQEIGLAVDSTITAAKKRLPEGGVPRQRIDRAYRTEITGFDGRDE